MIPDYPADDPWEPETETANVVEQRTEDRQVRGFRWLAYLRTQLIHGAPPIEELPYDQEPTSTTSTVSPQPQGAPEW